MCNATNSFSKLICGTLMMLSAYSCSSENDSQKVEADALLSQVEQLMDRGETQEALALMDSLDKTYPSQIQQRKKVKAMRPKAIEALTIAQIQHADSLIALAQLEIAQLQPQFKHISDNGLEGYYVLAEAYNPNFINSSAFEARVNDANNLFYIVALSNDRKIGITQVGLSGSSGECRSEALNSRKNQGADVEGSELASFMPEEVDSLGRWAYENQGAISSGCIYGSKGNVKFKISPVQAKAIGLAWRYANQKTQERNALILREKLDRKLQIARDQAANAALDIVE